MTSPIKTIDALANDVRMLRADLAKEGASSQHIVINKALQQINSLFALNKQNLSNHELQQYGITTTELQQLIAKVEPLLASLSDLVSPPSAAAQRHAFMCNILIHAQTMDPVQLRHHLPDIAHVGLQDFYSNDEYILMMSEFVKHALTNTPFMNKLSRDELNILQTINNNVRWLVERLPRQTDGEIGNTQDLLKACDDRSSTLERYRRLVA